MRTEMPDNAALLSEKHRAELHASGLTDHYIAKMGIYSTSDAEIHRILGWQPRHFRWGEGFVIPFVFPGEDKPSYHRVKLDFPRHDDSGSPVKYESPLRKPNRAYFPPEFWERIQDAPYILLTEGEKKAASATCRGLPTVGLVGVYGWQNKRSRRTTGKARGPRMLIADLNTLHWHKRKVAIVFDSDVAQKVEVKRAEAELANVLRGRGADVRIVRLPAGPNGAKVGLDDYLVTHETAALIELVEEAWKVASAAGIGDAGGKPKGSFMDWADQFLAERHMHADGPTLSYWRGEFYEFAGNHYRPVDEGDFVRRVLTWLDGKKDNATPRQAENVAKCIAARVLIEASIEQPVWQGREAGPANPADWIATRHEIVDLHRLMAGKTVVTRPNSPLWFCTSALPYAFRLDAECPLWQKWLMEVMEDDEDRVALLQEWAGYLLVPDTSLHKFLILLGGGANGKSVFLRVLESLIGEANVSHVGLDLFGARFQLGSTIGKLANIVPEVGELAKPDEAVFKAFVAGDIVQIDRKHLPMVQARPTARVTIATNTRPRWADRSNGIWRRMLIVPFRVTIPEDQQDRTLADRIIRDELPGVFLWAIAGLARLRERGRFTEPAICREAADEYRRETNPARMFLTDECFARAGAEIRSQDLYRAYVQWCEQWGYRPLSDTHFGHEIRMIYPVERFRRREGNVLRWYLAGLDCPVAHVPNETNEPKHS